MNEKDKKIVIDTLKEYQNKYEGLRVIFYNKEDEYFLNYFYLDPDELKLHPNAITAIESSKCYFYVNLNQDYKFWEYVEPDEDGDHEMDLHCVELKKESGMEVTFEFRKYRYEFSQGGLIPALLVETAQPFYLD